MPSQLTFSVHGRYDVFQTMVVMITMMTVERALTIAVVVLLFLPSHSHPHRHLFLDQNDSSDTYMV